MEPFKNLIQPSFHTPDHHTQLIYYTKTHTLLNLKVYQPASKQAAATAAASKQATTLCVYVRVCVRACERACVRVCVKPTTP